MVNQISPGIVTTEKDLTTAVSSVATSEGAIAGVFRWGPVGKAVLVSNEDQLVANFGKPTNYNPETFFTAADFLAYSSALYVVRAANTTDNTGANGALTAYANTSAVSSNVAHVVKNADVYDTVSATFEAGVQYVAKYPGALGNSLKISVCESAAQYESNVNIIANTAYVNTTSSAASFTVGANTANVVIIAANNTIGESQIANVASAVSTLLTVGDILQVGNTTTGIQYLKITSIGSTQNTVSGGIYRGFFQLGFDQTWQQAANASVTVLPRKWEFYNSVNRAPGQSVYQLQQGNTSANDQLHVVVTDEDGKFTGVPGQILEIFSGLSRATDAKTEDGASNYYKTVINNTSKYVWFATDRAGAVSNTALNLTSTTNTKVFTQSFVNGTDGDSESSVAVSVLTAGYDLFKNSTDIDISLVLAGKARGGVNGETLANYITANILEYRKDAVGFFSPDYADVVNASGSEATNVLAFRNSLTSSSYWVLDSGYKYRYDKYNDVNRYTPLNGDVAGTCARTDSVRDPWYSPGGLQRGQILNVIKLAYNPSQTDRDVLYKSDINPVVSFPGQGTVLYGDKTGLGRVSAFDRINVRRLFIVLRKTISLASRNFLFELNDEFTRQQFKSIVEPFLRDVQGRHGIIDFRVVCDESNNTGEVIDRNEFVGDIYIKPARSINFINLNFVAVRTGVEFAEIVGKA